MIDEFYPYTVNSSFSSNKSSFYSDILSYDNRKRDLLSYYRLRIEDAVNLPSY